MTSPSFFSGSAVVHVILDKDKNNARVTQENQDSHVL